MSGLKRRLDALCSSLTAKERGVLLLQAMKEDRQADPEVWRTLPPDQVEEVRLYSVLMEVVNHGLSPFLLVLEQTVAQLELRLAWVDSLHVWGLHAQVLAEYMALYTGEPVTEGEYQRILRHAWAKLVPACTLAELLADRDHGRKAADVESGGDCGGERQVSETARERVVSEKTKEIARLMEAGVIEGEMRDERRLVNTGSFYDWLGEPVPLVPPWGLSYDVLPDDREGEVRARRLARRQAKRVLQSAPWALAMIPGSQPPASPKKSRKRVPSSVGDMAVGLVARICDDIRSVWRDLRAVELLWKDVAAKFGGEDPAHPSTRQGVNQSKQKLDELKQRAQRYAKPFALGEPKGDELRDLKDFIQKVENRCLRRK